MINQTLRPHRPPSTCKVLQNPLDLHWNINLQNNLFLSFRHQSDPSPLPQIRFLFCYTTTPTTTWGWVARNKKAHKISLETRIETESSFYEFTHTPAPEEVIKKLSKTTQIWAPSKLKHPPTSRQIPSASLLTEIIYFNLPSLRIPNGNLNRRRM